MNAPDFKITLASLFFAGVTIGVSLQGCAGRAKPINQERTPTNRASITLEATRMPTIVSTPQPTSKTVPAAVGLTLATNVRSTPTLDCVNGLQFVADLTVPDGALIARGAQVDKRWQVKNSGTCNWDQRYALVLIAGTELGMPEKQALNPARSGSEAVIRMVLTSPMSPGIYTSAWQAFGPDGEPFGDVIYVQFQVN